MTAVMTSFVVTGVMTNFVVTVIVKTKLVGCYNQGSRNIYQLLHVCNYWHNKAQSQKFTNISSDFVDWIERELL